MNKLYVFLFIVFCSITRIDAQMFFNNYFEPGGFGSPILVKIDPDTNNIWQIGEPDKVLFKQAATQPNVIITDTINNYPDSNTSRFIVKVPQMQMWWGVLAFQWMQKLDMDSADIGHVEYSVNNGQSWVNTFNSPFVYNFYGWNAANQVTVNSQPGFGKRDTTWQNIWLCFSTSWVNQQTDTVMFRFTFISDTAGTPKEGWMIDNLIVSQTIIHTVKEGESDKPYLSVYPNPTNDILYIEAQMLKEFHIIETMQLMDADGKTLNTWQNIPTKFWIETKDLIPGNYYLRVKTNLREETLPFIIRR